MSTDVRGRVAIDVQFWDRTSSEGVQSLKTIALQDSTEYTTGKVAVVSGTCGTAAASVSPSLGTGYKNAAGDEILMSNGVSRVAFSASPAATATGDEGGEVVISRSSRISITEQADIGSNQTWNISTTAGTASYTLVLYGT